MELNELSQLIEVWSFATNFEC